MAVGCHPQPPPVVPSAPTTNVSHPQPPAQTRPVPRYDLSGDRDTVESFFAAVAAGDVPGLRAMTTGDHPNGIGGRTWEQWIRDFKGVQISRFQFHITDRHLLGDQMVQQVLLSNGAEMTFYLAPAQGEFYITAIDGRSEATTKP